MDGFRIQTEIFRAAREVGTDTPPVAGTMMVTWGDGGPAVGPTERCVVFWDPLHRSQVIEWVNASVYRKRTSSFVFFTEERQGRVRIRHTRSHARMHIDGSYCPACQGTDTLYPATV